MIEAIYKDLKKSKFGKVLVILLVLIISVFAIWNSLTDSMKESLFSPETMESVYSTPSTIQSNQRDRVEFDSRPSRVKLKGRAIEITTTEYTGVPPQKREPFEHQAAQFFCKDKGYKGMYTYEINHFPNAEPSWRYTSTGEKTQFAGKSSFTRIVCTL